MRSFLLLLVFLNVLIDAEHFQCNRKLPCGCGKSNVEINTRIINGEEAVPYSWPMIVSLRYDSLDNGNSFTHICGGSILTDSYILTAASCFNRIKGDVKLANITIAAGIHKRSQPRQIIRDVDEIIIHPNWTDHWNRYEHDIALLHLSESLDFQMNRFITRICLPLQLNTSEALMKYPPVGTSLAVVGWGRSVFYGDDSDILRQAVVSLIEHNDAKCADIVTDPNSQFCAGSGDVSVGSCYGDFGGPILQWIKDHWEQVGIASFTPDGCKQDSAIGYTRIAYYRDWIEEHIKNHDEVTEETSVTITNTYRDITEYKCDRNEVPCGCGSRNVQFSQSNNNEAIRYSWSMIVSIRLNGQNKHLCSGSILSESYILTSASCLANISSFGIIIAAGIHNHSEFFQTYRKVDRIYLHPEYTGQLDNYANDIAILHISEPLDIDNDIFISRTCLIKKIDGLTNSYFYPFPDTKLAVIGWGSMTCQNKTDQDVLQQVQVYSTDDLEKNCYILNKHRDMQFCAGLNNQDKVPCVADPGSPIFEWGFDRWEQVGIASYVFDCAPFRSLGIYTRTVEYNDWIQSIINNCSAISVSSSTTTTTTISISTTTVKPPVAYPCNRTSTCGCGVAPVVLTPSRIVGGENAVESSWPMIVSLRLFDKDRHWCGGTILSDSYILTAAHCLYGFVSNPPVNVTIAVGMTNLSDPKQIRRTVDHIYNHPNYTDVIGDHNPHDIAVLHLNQSLPTEYNPFLTKTCIHRVNPPTLNNQYIRNGTRLTVIGWGTRKFGLSDAPTILQQAEVYAIDYNDSICRDAMKDTEIQFCAGLAEGGKDSCQGDSGGPIFQWAGQYWEQVGIVSYGRGCAEPNQPGIYTRISYYYDWINDILKNNNEHLEPGFSTHETSVKPDITSTSGMVLNTTSVSGTSPNITSTPGMVLSTTSVSGTSPNITSTSGMISNSSITNEAKSHMTGDVYKNQANTLTFTLLVLLLSIILQ